MTRASPQSLIFFDLDRTIINPYHQRNQRFKHLWNEQILPILPVSEADSPSFMLEDQHFQQHCKNSQPLAANLLRIVTTHDNEELLYLIYEWLDRKMIAANSLFSDEQVTASINKINALILETKMSQLFPKEQTETYYEGIISLLERLTSEGHKLGIITARSRNESGSPMVANSPLMQYFEPWAIFDQTHGDKHCPKGRNELRDSILTVSRDEGISLNLANSMHIGDNIYDALLAEQIGCHYIHVSYGRTHDFMNRISLGLERSRAALERLKKKYYHAICIPSLDQHLAAFLNRNVSV